MNSRSKCRLCSMQGGKEGRRGPREDGPITRRGIGTVRRGRAAAFSCFKIGLLKLGAESCGGEKAGSAHFQPVRLGILRTECYGGAVLTCENCAPSFLHGCRGCSLSAASSCRHCPVWTLRAKLSSIGRARAHSPHSTQPTQPGSATQAVLSTYFCRRAVRSEAHSALLLGLALVVGGSKGPSLTQRAASSSAHK